nr:hypothetical protein [Chloroflexota bacterium]
DEETALGQFGEDDKYFGVATVMATLPGLPMLGHGQVEGYAEKYGMEFRRARLEEQPDPWLVARHEHEVFPLFHRRAWFAEAHEFLLYDLVTDGGGVDENVLAYSNGSGPTRSLVVYHTRFGSAAGTIRNSTAFARRSASGAKRLVRRSLAEGLGLPKDTSMFVRFRDARTGLEYIRSCRELWERGLWLSLDAYQGHVFWEFDEVHDGTAGQWRRLADRLAGAGVPSLDDALRELQLEPIHAPLRAVFDGGELVRVLVGSAGPENLDSLEAQLVEVLSAVAAATGVEGEPVTTAAIIRDEVAAALPAPTADGAGEDDASGTTGVGGQPGATGAAKTREDRAALLVYLVLSRIGALAPGADVAATSLAWYDELQLAPVVANGLSSIGLDREAAKTAADTVRMLLALPRASEFRGRGTQRDLRLLDRWLAIEPVRLALDVHAWDGEEYLDRARLAALLAWAGRLDAIESGSPPDTAFAYRLLAAAETASYRVDRLRAALSASPAKRPRERPPR